MDYLVFSDPLNWVGPSALAHVNTPSRLLSEAGRDDREAWVAARFTIGLSQFTNEKLQVRLVKPSPPDFEVQSGTDDVDQYETCEVLRPDRHRHTEFKEYDKTGLLPPLHIVRVDEARRYVLEGIEAKVNKLYSMPLNLLVYVDLGVPSFNMALPPELTSSFKSIWAFLASSVPVTKTQEYAMTRLAPDPMNGWFTFSIQEP